MKGAVVLTALLVYTAAALPQSNSSVSPATTVPQLLPLPRGTPATCYETVLTATLTCQYCEWVSTTSSASSGAVQTAVGVPTGSALSGKFVSSYVADGVTRGVWSIASRSAQWTAAPPLSGIPAYSPSSWSSMLHIKSAPSSRAESIVPTAIATPVYKPVINITEIASACPSYNDTFVVSNGSGEYLIECGIDHKGGDFYNNPFLVGDYAECLLTCDTHSACKAIAYVAGTPGFCYLKAEIMDGIPVSSVWGASRVQNQAATAPTSPTPFTNLGPSWAPLGDDATWISPTTVPNSSGNENTSSAGGFRVPSSSIPTISVAPSEAEGIKSTAIAETVHSISNTAMTRVSSLIHSRPPVKPSTSYFVSTSPGLSHSVPSGVIADTKLPNATKLLPGLSDATASSLAISALNPSNSSSFPAATSSAAVSSLTIYSNAFLAPTTVNGSLTFQTVMESVNLNHTSGRGHPVPGTRTLGNITGTGIISPVNSLGQHFTLTTLPSTGTWIVTKSSRLPVQTNSQPFVLPEPTAVNGTPVLLPPTPPISPTPNKPSVVPNTYDFNGTQIIVSSTIYPHSVLTIGTNSPSQSNISAVPLTSIRNGTQSNVSSTIYPHSVLTIGVNSPSQGKTSVVPATSIGNGTQSVVPSTLLLRNDTRSTAQKSITVMTTTITRTRQPSISSIADLINGTSSTVLPIILPGTDFTSITTMTRALNGSLGVPMATEEITQTGFSAKTSAISVMSGSSSSGLVDIPTTTLSTKKQTLHLPTSSNKVNITQSLLLPTPPVSSFTPQALHLPTKPGMRESRKSQSVHLPTSQGAHKSQNDHSLHPPTGSKTSEQRIQSLRIPITTTPFSVDIRTGIATVMTTDYIALSTGTMQAMATYSRFTTIATTYVTHKQSASSSSTAKALLPGNIDNGQQPSLTISLASSGNLCSKTLTASTEVGADGGYTLAVPGLLTTAYATSDVSPASSRLPSLRLPNPGLPTDLPLVITTVTVEDEYTVTLPFPLNVTAPPKVPVDDATVTETVEDILTTITENGIENPLTIPTSGPVGYIITLPTIRIPSYLTAEPKLPEPSATDVASSVLTEVIIDEVTYSGAIATSRKVTAAPNLPKTKTRNHHHHSGTHRHIHHDWSTPAPSVSPCTFGDLENLNATSIDQLFQVVKKLQEKIYSIKMGICDSGKRGSASGYEHVTDRLPPDVLHMFKTGQINYYHENGDFVYYVSLNESSVITPVAYDTNEYIDLPDEAECGACFEDNASADLRRRVQCETDCQPVIRRLNEWTEISVRAHWRHNAKVGVVEYKGSVVLPPDHRGVALDDETTPAAQPASNPTSSTRYAEGVKDAQDDENELLSASLSTSVLETASPQRQDTHTIVAASNRVITPIFSASGVLGSVATAPVSSGLKIAASVARSMAAEATSSLFWTSKEGIQYTTWTSWGLSSGVMPATSLKTSKSSTTAKPSKSSARSSSKTSSRTSTMHPSPTKHSVASSQTRASMGALMILVGVLGVLLL